jgi:ADP-heptose:LPS heptosyltransferase
MPERTRLVLSHRRAPGDIICLTSLPRDIHAAYPGKYELFVSTTFSPLWENNPHVTVLAGQGPPANARQLRMEYGRGIREQKHETIHFCNYFHRDFERQTGVRVPMSKPYGDLHLSATEQRVSPVSGRYWCVLSGGKSDFTAKVWATTKFQKVVDELRSKGLGIVQLGDTARGHWHPPLDGVLNLVGQTSLRDMLQLIAHADGVICGITGAMHAAAALQRPCVVLAGGREAWYWEAYVRENKGLGGAALAATLSTPHRFLHTIGLLPCCPTGCWRNKVVPFGNDKSICLYPVLGEQPVPKCLDLIEPSHVIEACMSYYADNSLPPIVPREQPIVLPPMVTSAAPAKPTLPKLIAPLAKAPPTQIQALPNTVAIPQRALSPNNLDHPDVGSRFTIFILFYGGDEYADMHRQCLDSILATVPVHRRDLRVGSNALGPKTLALLEEHVRSGTITKHYRHESNDYKYPVMREMFHDPACPITTKWVIWFDDDSIANKNPEWLSILAQTIVNTHKRRNVHMYGKRCIGSISPEQQALFKTRPWYKGRQFRGASGRPAPNGNKVIFVAGFFWAATTEAITKAGIPDLGTGLQNNGGDWQIGEQLYQAGFDLANFNSSKEYVNGSSAKRRGVTTTWPGAQAKPRAALAPLVPAVQPRKPVHKPAATPTNVTKPVRRGLTLLRL